MTKRPNILFLMTDEQRFDTFSHVNNEIKTPNIDKLIKESVFFKNAYCSNPSCIPSRAAIMTGKFPTQCQCPTYITKLPDNEKTFMTMLKDGGYHTSVVGKQHFAESGIEKGYIDEQIIDGHGPNGTPSEIQIYLDYLEKNGVDKKSLFENNLIVGGEWKGDIKYHIDHFVGELGKEWLQSYDKEDPWFFTLSFPGPHQPFDGEGTEYADQYELDDISMPKTKLEHLDQKPPHYKGMKSKAFMDKYDDETFKKTKRAYYANMSLIDQKISEVIDILKERDMYDNTMIIYTADHGDFMGDFGMLTKAQYLSEALMRVPLFVKPPVKDFKGFEVEEKVLNIDLASTCLKVAGVPLEKDMTDYDYTCYWDKDAEIRVRDYIYMEAGNIKGVIKNGIKLYHYVDRPYGEIYDLNSDPLEINNLWDDGEYQIKKLELSRLIINQMFKMTPKWDIKWNVADPEI